jgi:biopolymer transport protein ExbD
MSLSQSLGRASRFSEPVAMKDMNTTPLIDVMLVLLIMFIITLPPATHAVKVDVPSCPAQGCPLPLNPNPVINTLYIAPNDAITWNGKPLANKDLMVMLQATQQMKPIPELRLQPDAKARHEAVMQVIKTTKLAKVRNFGFVGNDNYVDY